MQKAFARVEIKYEIRKGHFKGILSFVFEMFLFSHSLVRGIKNSVVVGFCLL